MDPLKSTRTPGDLETTDHRSIISMKYGRTIALISCIFLSTLGPETPIYLFFCFLCAAVRERVDELDQERDDQP